jgi:hypothetical protein
LYFRVGFGKDVSVMTVDTLDSVSLSYAKAEGPSSGWNLEGFMKEEKRRLIAVSGRRETQAQQ